MERTDGDAGVGLVEVLVGMLMASIAMAALAQMLVTSVQAQRADNLRATASGLAIAELEGIQALPWSLVGHYGNDPGLPAGALVLAATRPAGARAPLPVSTGIARGAGTYTVSRTVSWYDDPATGNPTDYKQLSVVVGWTTAGGAKSTRVDSIRTPQLGELAPSDLALRGATVTPADQTLSAGGQTSASMTVGVELTAPASSATVTWTDRTGTAQSRTLATSDGGRTFSTTFSAGTCCFVNGSTAFVATVIRNSPATTVRGTANVLLLEPLAVTSVTPTPGDQCPAAVDVTVAVSTSGTSAGDGEVVVTGSSGGGPWPAVLTSTTPSGGTWSATVPASALPAGTTLTATATRARPSLQTASATTAAVASC